MRDESFNCVTGVSCAVTVFVSACLGVATVTAQSVGVPPGNGADVFALIPFTNITGNAEDAWIGAGIAESIRSDVTCAPGLKVVETGRTDVGRDLGATPLVAIGLPDPVRMACAVGSHSRAGRFRGSPGPHEVNHPVAELRRIRSSCSQHRGTPIPLRVTVSTKLGQLHGQEGTHQGLWVTPVLATCDSRLWAASGDPQWPQRNPAARLTAGRASASLCSADVLRTSA